MYPELTLYIDGKFIPAEGRHVQDVHNPCTAEKIGTLPHATPDDLEAALAAAQRAFRHWKNSSPLERSAVLRRVAALARERASDIARNITLDQGKPLTEATTEVMVCAEYAEWHAEECRRIYGRVIPSRDAQVRQFVVREPVGVCAAFTPWNFPFNQAMRKIAGAVGAGCTLILKGPEDSPSAIVALAQLFHDAGLPPGVLNIVWGVPSQVSKTLIESPVVRKISFTGSVPVGKQLAAMAGQQMKRMTMELGGHSPVLVFGDADIDRAAEMLAHFKMRNAGQVCISPTRFYVQDGVYDRFLDRFVSVLASLKIGNGLTPGVQMGPLAHARRVLAMEDFVAEAVGRGAKAALGGKRIGDVGHFFAPTVLTDVPDDAKVMLEEPFGPIAPVIRFKTLEEVLERANSLPYGLAAYVFTNSLRTAHVVSSGLEAGIININHFGAGLAETPFGGVKDSGIGSEGGVESFDGYLVTKFVTQL